MCDIMSTLYKNIRPITKKMFDKMTLLYQGMANISCEQGSQKSLGTVEGGLLKFMVW